MNRLFLGVAFCCITLPAQAAPRTTEIAVPQGASSGVQHIEVSIDPPTAKRGQTVTWRLTVDPKPGWHGYPTSQLDEQASAYVTAFEFELPKDLVAVETLREAAGNVHIDSDLGYRVFELEGKITWERPIVVSPDATPGEKSIRVKVSGQICKKVCVPLKLELSVPLTVTAESVPVDPKYAAALNQPSGPQPAAPSRPVRTEEPAGNSSRRSDITLDDVKDYEGDMEWVRAQLSGKKSMSMGLLAFLVAGVFWGAVSIVTPCVFPMIPITVSYFLKQSEKEHSRPLLMATVYCGTIVAVLTFAAVLLLSFFRLLSINPIMNLGLGALLIFFALSLFGMYEIELPAGLARLTSSRESQGGLVGTIFMALTFTIVSFACVAPFLGGFAGTAATTGLSWWALALGGLAFSATFAAPFFILALFPTLLKSMPRSGAWLNSVKVVMGFLEFAAALKFFRVSEIMLSAHPPTYFTYDLVLGLYVALSLLCGLYLLGIYRLEHDSPVEHLSVPRLLFSLSFLGLALYLAPGLFKSGGEGQHQRPGGTIYAWVDSFLLPEPQEGKASGLAWSPNLRQAVEETRAAPATAKKKRIFIDFTGVT